MTKLTTERLETIATWREKYGNGANVMIPAEEAELMARQLLAYKQAAKKPIGSFHISGGQVEATTDYCRDGEWPVQDGEVLVYAAPVLPKQPELIGMKVSIDTGSDNIGHRLFGEIVGTSDSNGVPVLCIEVAENNADVTLADEGETAKIVKAAEKLVRCKGRYHSEQNYRALAALFGVTVPDLPPLPSDEAPAQPVIPEQTERERIRREHAEWSDATFGNVGPVGPLKHLSKEALEAAADPDDLLEWADMQFLLWDAQRRMGIPDDFITIAMAEKLEINKKRQWPEPKDGEPRLHINTQSAQPVSNPYKFIDERAKYRVIIEGFSNSRSVDFEACSQEEAEEIGRDIFHEECNYGVERLESIPAQGRE